LTAFLGAILLGFTGCRERKEEDSAVELLRVYRTLPADQVALLDFGSDTLETKGNTVLLTGYNRSRLPLMVAAVVPSCTCALVSFDKKFLRPGDGIRIRAVFRKGFKAGSVTVIGNLSGGQKTVYLTHSGR